MKNCLTTALFLTIFFGISSLNAAQLYWDPNATTGTAPGGTGNWDQVDGFWYNGTSDVIWANANGDDALFTGTAGTVTLTDKYFRRKFIFYQRDRKLFAHECDGRGSFDDCRSD